LRTEGPYRFLEGMNALNLRRGPGFKSPRRLRFGDGGFNPQGNSSSLYSLPLMKSDAESTQSETLVAVHNVRPSMANDYARWLEDSGKMEKEFPGFLSREVTQPMDGAQSFYTLVVRFDSSANLSRRLDSGEWNGLHARL